MNVHEVRALIPESAPNSDKLARLLQAVTAVSDAESRWAAHLRYLAQLRSLIECTPAKSAAFHKVKKAHWLAIRAATTWAKRNGKPHSFDAVNAAVDAYVAATPAVFLDT